MKNPFRLLLSMIVLAVATCPPLHAAPGANNLQITQWNSTGTATKTGVFIPTGPGGLLGTDANGIPILLARGTVGQVLTMAGGIPTWADAGTGVAVPATAWVETTGSDVTGAIGQQNLPFATFAASYAALPSNGGTLRFGVGTFAPLGSQLSKANVTIIGAARPNFASDYLSLTGGTIIKGPLIYRANNLQFRNFGVDSGTTVCNALYSGTAQEGLACTVSYIGSDPQFTRLVVDNVIGLAKNYNAAVHAFACEGYSFASINNVETYFGFTGQAYKVQYSTVSNIRSENNSTAGITIKSDTVRQCKYTTFTNLVVDGLSAGLYGILLQCDSNASGNYQELNNIAITNAVVRNAASGFVVIGNTTTARDLIRDCTFTNIQANACSSYGIQVYGYTNRLTFVNCSASSSTINGYLTSVIGNLIKFLGCSSTNSGGDGFKLVGATDELSNCTATDNGGYGFLVDAAATAYESNNGGSGNSSGLFGGAGTWLEHDAKGTISALNGVEAGRTIRVTGAFTPASGSGLEFQYGAIANTASIASYNHTGAAYRAMLIDGLTLGLNTGSGGAVSIGGNTVVTGTLGASNLSGTNTGDQNIFGSVVVSGQTTVTASANPTALTLIAGTNVTLTTNNAAKSVTINSTGSGTGTVTVAGGGNLTSTAFMTGGGSQVSQTPSATSTLDASGNAVFAGTLSIGTSNPATVGTIELGAASDTTLSRSAAGVLAVEGVVIPSISSTNTLTNKSMSGSANTFTNLPAAGILGVIPIANLATGTPNGAKYIRDDGTLATPSGSGTVTVVGAGNLTSTALVTGGGAQALQTPSTTSTLDASGNLVLAGNMTLGASTSSITGAAGNMTITAGTGNSRLLLLRSTTSGGTATTFLTGNADQTVTFAAGATFAGAVTIGTSNAFTTGTIELGAASDTTLARVSAGVVSIEGSNIITAATGVTAASTFGTDNRILRSDGTGRGAQSTGITVDDSDNVTGPASISTGGLTGTSFTITGLGTGPVAATAGVFGLSTATNQSSPIYAADAGSTDAYAITLAPVPASYVAGTLYRFKANTANTGAATLNVNSLGAKTIVKVAGGVTTALADNDILAGQFVDVVYDGTNLQIQSTLGNAPSGSVTLTSTQVAYGSGGNTVTSEAAFSYAATPNILTVGGISTGAGGETSSIGALVDAVDGTTPLNNIIQTVASGTAYTLTTSYADVTFGTTSPTVTLINAGTYSIYITLQTSLVSATTTTQSVSFKLRRTNNTAADLSGSTFGNPLPVATITSELGPTTTIGPIKYTTANTNDVIGAQGIISASLGAGTATVTAATITAERAY